MWILDVAHLHLYLQRATILIADELPDSALHIVQGYDMHTDDAVAEVIPAMIAEDKPIEVVCDFCRTKYAFSAEELLRMLKEGRPK